MFEPDIISKAAAAVSASVADTVAETQSGEIETEPSLTDRLLASIKRSINKIDDGSVQLFARTLRDRGPNAAEKEFGADLCCVLRVKLPGYEVSKGFLVQSKWPKTGKWKNEFLPVGIEANLGDILIGVRSHYLELPYDSEFERSQKQCRTMLRYSPASFVFVYTNTGIYVTPAISFAGFSGQKAMVLDLKTLPVFFTDFLRCFVGDPGLQGWQDEDLRKLRVDTRARDLLVIDALPPNHIPPESGLMD